MTVPIATLRAVKRAIVHANCPDGRASALILRAVLPTVEIVEMAYNSPEHDNLVAEPGLLFCDFTPPKKRLAEFAAVGTIVLDHHERALVEPFGELGAFADNAVEPGVSGAMLAYREVLVPVKGPLPREGSTARAWWNAAKNIAELAGIRDTWVRDSPRWNAACAMSEAFRFVPLDEVLKRGLQGMSLLYADLGPLLVSKKRAAAEEAAKNTVVHDIAGRRVAVVSSTTMAEEVSDLLPEVDIVAGFDYRQDKGGERVRLKISLRSRTVDVQAIAKCYGGGGHKAAAGFHASVDVAGDECPYKRIHSLVAEHLLGVA